jgi:hypothetical protein
MEAKSTPDHASGIEPMNCRRSWTWHGTAPPAWMVRHPTPSLTNIFRPFSTVGAIAIMSLAYEFIAFRGEVNCNSFLMTMVSARTSVIFGRISPMCLKRNPGRRNEVFELK